MPAAPGCTGGRSVPFTLDADDGPDVVLGGEDKLIIQHPLRLGVEHSGRMQGDYLQTTHMHGVSLLAREPCVSRLTWLSLTVR